jgi:hypothetical protein
MCFAVTESGARGRYSSVTELKLRRTHAAGHASQF